MGNLSLTVGPSPALERLLPEPEPGKLEPARLEVAAGDGGRALDADVALLEVGPLQAEAQAQRVGVQVGGRLQRDVHDEVGGVHLPDEV